jgi:hypothetical protein
MSANTETDSRRRLAAQLAIQLPQNVAEAHYVLNLTGDMVDHFLVEPMGEAHRRARRLGWRLEQAAADDRVPLLAPGLAWATLWGLSSLGLSLPIGAGMVALFGAGAGMTFAVATMVVALVLGTLPAFALAIVTPVLHNLFIVPPALHFTPPTNGEIIAAASYLLIAVLVPFVDRQRRRIRAALPLAPNPLDDEIAALRSLDRA